MASKKCLVYGGKGALGNELVRFFKSKGWWVGNIDMGHNEEASVNIAISHKESLVEQEKEVVEAVKQIVRSGQQEKFDAIFCVAGGWAGGNASNDDFAKNVDLVLKQSVWSSCITARLSSLFLKDGGLVTFCGAHAALEPTPHMIGYGLAKAAVHHLVQSLAAPKSGLPEHAVAVAILPVMLDTPMNRKWMPKADTSTWTPLQYVADTFHQWAENTNRPRSGSLVSLITEKGETNLQYN